MQIDIKFLSQRSKEIYKNGELLKYQTNCSSGFDIMATGIKDVKNKTEFIFNKDDDFFILKPSHSVLVLSGFSFALDSLGYEMQIRSRSGLALKNNVVVLNSPGTVDNDYRGEIGVILINHSSEDFKICSGDRIAQAVISKIEQVNITIVENLDNTTRGIGGFGSTGK